jgi:hypothetical protein
MDNDIADSPPVSPVTPFFINENMRADAHGHANIDAALNVANAQMFERAALARIADARRAINALQRLITTLTKRRMPGGSKSKRRNDARTRRHHK